MTKKLVQIALFLCVGSVGLLSMQPMPIKENDPQPPRPVYPKFEEEEKAECHDFFYKLGPNNFKNGTEKMEGEAMLKMSKSRSLFQVCFACLERAKKESAQLEQNMTKKSGHNKTTDLQNKERLKTLQTDIPAWVKLCPDLMIG